MGVQVVLNMHNLTGLREMNIAEIAQDTGVADRRTPVRDLHMAPAFRRGKQDEGWRYRCAYIHNRCASVAMDAMAEDCAFV